MNQETSLLSNALEATRRAAGLCEAVRQELVVAMTKSDRSPVTIADFGAQAVVQLTLAEAAKRSGQPSIPMVGEEDAAALRAGDGEELCSLVVEHVQRILPGATRDQILDAIDAGSDPGGATGRRWVLDPIDGTKGFLRGDQYAIALALLDEGQVRLGVLGCPFLPRDPSVNGPAANESKARGCLFAARRGEGAQQIDLLAAGHEFELDQPRRIHAASLDDPSQAAFCESVESAHSAHSQHAQIADDLGVKASPVRMDSQCKYAAVARGQAAIYLRLPKSATYQEKIWDHAAGAIVVEQAGGRVTDAHGKELDFSLGRTLANNSGIVATNGRLHERVLAAVAKVL